MEQKHLGLLESDLNRLPAKISRFLWNLPQDFICDAEATVLHARGIITNRFHRNMILAAKKVLLDKPDSKCCRWLENLVTCSFVEKGKASEHSDNHLTWSDSRTVISWLETAEPSEHLFPFNARKSLGQRSTMTCHDNYIAQLKCELTLTRTVV